MQMDSSDVATQPERRQAVWPWLLLPLVTLALFLALRSFRESAGVLPPEGTVQPVGTEAAGVTVP